MLIIENVLYLFGKAKVEEVLMVISLALSWIILRLVGIFSVLEDIKKEIKEKRDKK
jgi:hypothetical protein